MAKKIVFSLDKLCGEVGEDLGLGGGEVILSVTNVDDIFTVLRKRGIKEVKVNVAQMLLIANYMVANARDENLMDGLRWKAIKILQEGKVDKLLGVKLILEE